MEVCFRLRRLINNGPHPDARNPVRYLLNRAVSARVAAIIGPAVANVCRSSQ